MGIEGYWKHRKANSFSLLIPENIKNHLLKVALDERQVMGIVAHTLFCNYKSKYGIYT